MKKLSLLDIEGIACSSSISSMILMKGTYDGSVLDKQNDIVTRKKAMTTMTLVSTFI